MKELIIDFTSIEKVSNEDILSSPYLVELVEEHLSYLKRSDATLISLLRKTFGEKRLALSIISFYKQLLSSPYLKIKSSYHPFTISPNDPINFLDSIYDLWRQKERYAFIDRSQNNISSSTFLSLMNSFSEKVVSCYRSIYENILGNEQRVYRQLPSGINAGLLINKASFVLPKDLLFLNDSLALESLLIRPPFICTSKENTRTGVFYEKNAPLMFVAFKANDYVAVPILVKEEFGLIYIHKDYLSFLVALGNLFQFADIKTIKDRKPNFITVFGADIPDDLAYYYKDEDAYVGLVPLHGHIAYFGYLKKIILTLHNLSQIDKGRLPIHGAGIEFTLSDGRIYNVILLGDSGAGKSETVETIKRIANDDVEIKTIFDDMGVLAFRDNEIVTIGSETGAFVRLDDLGLGYSLQSIDRAIYINIDRTNSRVVIPVETFEMASSLHKVDAILLADNFTQCSKGVIQYKDKNLAIQEFEKGERMAKGTTSEMGLVSTYFANPFGPMQREKETHQLVEKYFDSLFKNSIYVGRLFTRLAIDPIDGPKTGAQALLELLKKLD